MLIPKSSHEEFTAYGNGLGKTNLEVEQKKENNKKRSFHPNKNMMIERMIRETYFVRL